MTEKIYEFLEIERQDGPFAVPGEIVEVCDDAPHSKQSFVALVELTEEVTEEDESQEEAMDWDEFDGIGATVSTRMKAAGFRTKTDVLEADLEEMCDQVKGLGPGTAENLYEEINE